MVDRVFTKKDFRTDQEIRWCPGCGNYAVLGVVQKVLAATGFPPEHFVFVSGIGCSGRFPYYMNTYGFHGIHGRAPAVATGLKIARPELSVWVVTGDGDGLSIGGNHFIHLMRRNPDINVLLLNNRIYALTKGQCSPTSEVGKRTKSTPFGSLENPLNPVSVALGAGATFVARALDSDVKGLQEIITQAAAHKGTSFVEIFQNCVVFNNGAFKFLNNRENGGDNVLHVEHEKPLLFGKDNEKGIACNKGKPEVVTIGKDGAKAEDILVYDAGEENPFFAFMLSQMGPPEFPTPLGVFRAVTLPTYEDSVNDQVRKEKERLGSGDLEKLLNSGETWSVS